MNLQIPKLNVSYKPQIITPKFVGTVKELLKIKINSAFSNPKFVSDVTKPMNLDDIIDKEVQKLSGFFINYVTLLISLSFLLGGELQRVALILALGKTADVYLIDEPSAYLDSEKRIIAAKVIKQFILKSKKTALIVEHDFIMATYLADQYLKEYNAL